MTDEAVAKALTAAGLDAAGVRDVIHGALAEDLRLGPDVTTEATVSPDARTSAVVAARQSGVVAGVSVALAVLEAVDKTLDAQVVCGDGASVAPGDHVMNISGPTRSLLLAERTLLNLLCHLSGIATATRAWVDAVAGTRAVVRDTRKTTPGLRQLEKYAVRCGGGANHRMALGDAALIKDNHIVAAGGVTAAIEAVRSHSPHLAVEVECDTLDQVREALAAGASEILLDNMTPPQLSEAVGLARSHPNVTTEASGGLRLDDAAAVAATGVTYISVGALTHSAVALDLGLDFA